MSLEPFETVKTETIEKDVCRTYAERETERTTKTVVRTRTPIKRAYVRTERTSLFLTLTRALNQSRNEL